MESASLDPFPVTVRILGGHLGAMDQTPPRPSLSPAPTGRTAKAEYTQGAGTLLSTRATKGTPGNLVLGNHPVSGQGSVQAGN